MNNTSDLKEKRTRLESGKDTIRQFIDGCLNRISVTDSEEEREEMSNRISSLIIEYVELSRQSHKLFLEIYKHILGE